MKTQQRLKECLENIKKKNKEINAILELRNEKELLEEARIIDEKIKNKTAGKLAGKIIIVKANICVNGLVTSCASKVLENYVAPYDAEVVAKIKKEDGLIIGNANMDEFACGSSGETSAFGVTKNPVNKEIIPGGSSSGSAAAVAADFCDIALGSDTGGSIRCPSSYCGVIGLKPTYASVSRYGLIDLSMSLDQIGPIAKNLEEIKLMYEVIKGKDVKDAISQEREVKLDNNFKIGILDLSKIKVDSFIENLFKNKINSLGGDFEIQKIKLDNLDLAVETYYPLVYVEIYSSSRKLDGRRFGKPIEKFAGPEVMRRILGGAEITKAEHGGRYYNKSLKVKEIIEGDFSEIFNGKNKVDAIVCPTMPRLPWKLGEKISIEEGYAADILTIPSNLAGNCAISIPLGKSKEGLPIGLQIICDKFQEEKLFEIAKMILSNNNL